jgi:hypothetical protein
MSKIFEIAEEKIVAFLDAALRAGGYALHAEVQKLIASCSEKPPIVTPAPVLPPEPVVVVAEPVSPLV